MAPNASCLGVTRYTKFGRTNSGRRSVLSFELISTPESLERECSRRNSDAISFGGKPPFPCRTHGDGEEHQGLPKPSSDGDYVELRGAMSG